MADESKERPKKAGIIEPDPITLAGQSRGLPAIFAVPFSQRILPLALLWFAGLYLRLPILVIPALAPDIQSELALSQTGVGALTTIPVLMLSLGAVPGALLIARFGPLAALVGALVLLAFASMARGLAPPVALLFGGTILAGLAIAIMQPSLPAIVLRWTPSYAALGSAVYMNGMLMGEFVGAGFTLPLIMPLVDNAWRAALAVWSIPTLLVAAAIGIAHRSGRVAAAEPGPPSVASPPWRLPRLWHLGIILGAASAGYFGTNAYLATILEHQGQGERLSIYLFFFNGAQVVGSLSMIALARWLIGKRQPIVIMAWGVAIALVSVMTGSGWFTLVAAFALGIATCVQLVQVVGLVPQIATSERASSLSAGLFTIGYLLGFVVPLAGGLLVDGTGNAGLVLVPTLILAVLAVVAAHRARDMAAAL